MASTVPMAIQIVTSGDLAAANSMARVAGAVDKVGASVGRTQQGMRSFSGALGRMSGVPEQFTSSLFALNEALDRSGGSMSQFGKFAAGAAAYAALGFTIKTLADRFGELRAQIELTNAGLEPDKKMSAWKEVGMQMLDWYRKYTPEGILLDKMGAFPKAPSAQVAGEMTPEQKAENSEREREAARARFWDNRAAEEEKARAMSREFDKGWQADARDKIWRDKDAAAREAAKADAKTAKETRGQDAPELAVRGSSAWAASMARTNATNAGSVERMQLSKQTDMLVALQKIERRGTIAGVESTTLVSV